MYKTDMKVRAIIVNEHAPDKSQVNLYPATTSNQPGDMQLWIPNDKMEGIKAGAVVTITVAPLQDPPKA